MNTRNPSRLPITASGDGETPFPRPIDATEKKTAFKIATLARKDLERFFYIQVNLQCWVKVKEDWRNKEGLIHNFGLDNPE